MRRLALFAFVLAIAASGCGGGGGGGGLSQEEFVAELDQICADFNAKQDEIGEPETLEDVAEQGPQVQAEFEAAVERIRDLGDPPAEIAEDADRFREIAEDSQRLIGDLVDAAEANDLQRAEAIAEEGQALNDESEEIARELGAENCAED
jgi:predicted  nucleic acid-binding Zn-ribbon protein